MTRTPALLVTGSDPPPEKEEDWNKWYYTQHIPSRLNNVSGFKSARRFVAVEGEPKYLALYDLESIKVLTGEAYLKLREIEKGLPSDSFEATARKVPNFSRGLYEQIYPVEGKYEIPDTKFIFAVGHDMPQSKEEEFNAWYDTEHIPAMKRVPGYVTFRRFKIVDTAPSGSGNPEIAKAAVQRINSPKYIAVYDLDNDKVFQSESFIKERDSPWSSWVRSWYTRRFRYLGRLVYSSQQGR